MVGTICIKLVQREKSSLQNTEVVEIESTLKQKEMKNV